MNQAKRAILVVSFGTTIRETRQANIDVLETEIQRQYPQWEVRRAFTSGMVRARILEEEGVRIDPPATALENLRREGFTEVIVQPTHIIPGEEYDRLTAAMEPFRTAGAFSSFRLGRPLLCCAGPEPERPDDYRIAVEALKAQLPDFAAEDDCRVILMGHGTGHRSDHCYDLLQSRLDAAGLPVFTATVEGSRTFEDALVWLERSRANKVGLMPFMLVAGDHALNDMAGAEPDSWRSRLQSLGYRVESCLCGLGENPAFRRIYLQHVAEAGDYCGCD